MCTDGEIPIDDVALSWVKGSWPYPQSNTIDCHQIEDVQKVLEEIQWWLEHPIRAKQHTLIALKKPWGYSLHVFPDDGSGFTAKRANGVYKSNGLRTIFRIFSLAIFAKKYGFDNIIETIADMCNQLLSYHSPTDTRCRVVCWVVAQLVAYVDNHIALAFDLPSSFFDLPQEAVDNAVFWTPGTVDTIYDILYNDTHNSDAERTVIALGFNTNRYTFCKHLSNKLKRAMLIRCVTSKDKEQTPSRKRARLVHTLTA